MKIGIVLNDENVIIGTLVPPAEDDLIIECEQDDIMVGVTKYIEKLVNPSSEELEKIREEEAVREKQTFYENRVEELVGVKYSVRQELSIQRQRDEKPEEFKQYYEYVEQCKAQAKAEIYK